MTSGVRTRFSASRARWMLVVLAVVAGVLAMHALAPTGMPASGQHSTMMPVGTTQHHAAPVHTAGDTCRHLSDADSGGDTAMHHAGGTCAAAGTGSAYAPPALLPAPTVPGAPAAAARSNPAARTVDGRAPPDLSELQLLRI
ncbi:DUF6153 family protein [Streptomyces sp. NPDC005202]|uniref:DUF6153 family protein n=1 Tax=Streptomyces sp. NPDC005202 TaxID=3157021 RepID=UPI0033B77C10